MKKIKDIETDIQRDHIPKPIYSCDICSDTGWVDVDGTEAQSTLIIEDLDFVTGKTVERKRCGCVIQRDFENKLLRAGLEPILHKIKTKEYVRKYDWQKELYLKARSFIEDNNQGLIISGQTGSGKTLLLGKMLYNFAHKGKEVFYFDWHNDYKGLLIDRYNVVDEDIMDKLLTVDVLYIDDLFKVENSDYTQLRNHEIMNARKIIDRRSQLPHLKTMVSMELDSSDIQNIEPSLNGRMIELVGTFDNWVQMDPKEDRNIRLQQAKGEF